MISAKEARETLNVDSSYERNAAYNRLNTDVEYVVTEALANKRHSAFVSTTAPEDVIYDVTKELRSLGYFVKVETLMGAIGSNLYREPRVSITLFW